MKSVLTSLFCLFTVWTTTAQLDARLMRFPDVSATHITFVYGNDVWIVSKSGGTALRLSSPEGVELFPRFSPDGSQIAFTGNYDGNNDVYVIPTTGGIPNRLTYHGMEDLVVDWTVDGETVLFRSSRESGKQRFSQFYTISRAGGPATKLPVPYGEFASYNADGSKLAFTDRSRVHRTWKRYEGGNAAEIQIFDMNNLTSEYITTNNANDEIPMWSGDHIYFISDRGEEKRYNIWKYNTSSGNSTQVTNFTDFDIHYPALGPEEIVFQAGDKLYLLDLDTDQFGSVDINVVTDQASLLPTQKNVGNMIQSATLSPDGQRVVLQARGELFNLPATEGFVSNMTQTSGAAERYPGWSPDGKMLAYWSDESGEYQLMIRNMKEGTTRKLTNFAGGYRYDIFWSPDSRKIAFINHAMEIQYLDIATSAITTMDQAFYLFEGGLRNFSVSWSPDSRWIAYSRDLNMAKKAIFIFDTRAGSTQQVTSGYYLDASPAFSADGKHLFFTTDRELSPEYSDLDNTFIYPNTTQIAVAALTSETGSILSVKNDIFDMKEDEKEEESEKADKKKSKKKEAADEEDQDKTPPVDIDFTGFENRVEIIDGVSGNLGRLSAVEGKLIYAHFPNTGASDEVKSSLKFYDIEDREHKTIIAGVGNYKISADGKKLLIRKDGKWSVIKLSDGAKVDKSVPTSNMTMAHIPREEWQQIFHEVWRLERDYFYDPNMHGVDWSAMKTRYGALIEQANSREDVNFIIGELIGELNASHTYRGGGDQENPEFRNVGYLGADFVVENGRYKISRIVNGGPWDAEVRSPLMQTGLNVKPGEYLLAVNGEQVTDTKPIHAWLQGKANTPVELTLGSNPSTSGSRTIVVKPLSSETRLRHLEWIESNRKRVEEATNGRIGYVYVPSTGRGGQTELVRQYYGQLDKEGVIIDERFNNGGQIPDRFIELLNRKPLAYWAVRDGKDWPWPPIANFGPKVMLINGFSGSGGDAFPDYFKKAGVGPLIGMRTWGGLIGVSGAPTLIDNGGVTVPTFRMYDPDGEWFKEGHGVEPDIEVRQDFTQLAQGWDVQLEAAITEVMRLLNSSGSFKKPTRPAYESRNE